MRHRGSNGQAGPASVCGLAILALSLGASTGCQMAALGQNADGVRLYRQGNYPAALQRFQGAASTDPRNADAYYNMGSTYHRLAEAQLDEQMVQQAEQMYNRCLDFAPDHVDCHRALAVLLVESGRSDRAFRLLENWSIRSPQLASPHVELARLYQEFGDEDTAKVQLQEAIHLDATDRRAWAALARLHEQSGDLQQALANYQRSYALNPFQPRVAERIASLQQRTSPAMDLPTGGTRTVQGSSANGRY